jgi:hypothetical protein
MEIRKSLELDCVCVKSLVSHVTLGKQINSFLPWFPSQSNELNLQVCCEDYRR